LHALFIAAKAPPMPRTNAIVSAIISEVFMAKLACFSTPRALPSPPKLIDASMNAR
jgi:hypothetical protein